MPYFRLLLLILCLTTLSIRVHAQTAIHRSTYNAEGLTLTIELLDDDLAHFELTASQPGDERIGTSPMVLKTDYAGASVTIINDQEIETPEMRLHVDANTLCVTATDLTRKPILTLTTMCPLFGEKALKGLSLTQEGATDVYGLGQQFRRRAGTDGNWMGGRRLMPNQYGNGLVNFNGGKVGNTQIPILYVLDEGTENYALFIDHVYPQYWSFNADPFTLQTPNVPLRWYLMTGKNLPDLRADYLELTGKPPVPPKQMFGLWVSEYGYENWEEVIGVLNSLREANFPVDGFMLDLQWFGGIGSNSQMGSLTWDEENFPDPSGMIARLREEYGIGIMTIEEPYVSKTASGYEEGSGSSVCRRFLFACRLEEVVGTGEHGRLE